MPGEMTDWNDRECFHSIDRLSSLHSSPLPVSFIFRLKCNLRLYIYRCVFQQVPSSQLEERISMLHLQHSEEAETTDKTCYSRYKTCCYLTLVFSIIAATIVIIIYVALGGLRGGGM